MVSFITSAEKEAFQRYVIKRQHILEYLEQNTERGKHSHARVNKKKGCYIFLNESFLSTCCAFHIPKENSALRKSYLIQIKKGYDVASESK